MSRVDAPKMLCPAEAIRLSMAFLHCAFGLSLANCSRRANLFLLLFLSRFTPSSFLLIEAERDSHHTRKTARYLNRACRGD